jgi:propanol-preferring alcohol dehydrogenase
MKAMRYHGDHARLRLEEIPSPEPGPGQLRVAVRTCGVCRTDLHLIDHELDDPILPIVPGHEIVGTVESIGPGVTSFEFGQRVGIPWLGWTCGACRDCRRGMENLCDQARFTGLHIDGGYADFAVADARYCFALPDEYSDLEVAPLLCAGLIGHRAYRMAGNPQRIGIYGFGAAAHLIAQVAIYEGREVFAFTRPGDIEAQDFARSLGATWVGGSNQSAPVPLDAALLFAPVGSLVPTALRAVTRGGTVICAGIHMSDIPSFPYELLWGERSVRSVANLTRVDAVEFLEIAPRVPIRITTVAYDFADANAALEDLRKGAFTGAAVLQVS